MAWNLTARNLKVQRLSAGVEQWWYQEWFQVVAVSWVVVLRVELLEFPKVSEC